MFGKCWTLGKSSRNKCAISQIERALQRTLCSFSQFSENILIASFV